MPPRDYAYLWDMLRAARRIHEAVTGISADDFANDWMRNAAVKHEFMIMGEAAKRLSAEFRAEHTDIPWRSIAGLRDVLIHSYDVIVLPRIWQFAQEQILQLSKQLDSILRTEAPLDESE